MAKKLTKADKELAQKAALGAIEDIQKKIQALQEEMVSIADANGVAFGYDPLGDGARGGYTYRPKGYEDEATTDLRKDWKKMSKKEKDENGWEDFDQYAYDMGYITQTGWLSSSDFC